MLSLAAYSLLIFYSFFFFSSRRRHTRCLSDWSSDVCSSSPPEKPSYVRWRPREYWKRHGWLPENPKRAIRWRAATGRPAAGQDQAGPCCGPVHKSCIAADPSRGTERDRRAPDVDPPAKPSVVVAPD